MEREHFWVTDPIPKQVIYLITYVQTNTNNPQSQISMLLELERPAEMNRFDFVLLDRQRATI